MQKKETDQPFGMRQYHSLLVVQYSFSYTILYHKTSILDTTQRVYYSSIKGLHYLPTKICKCKFVYELALSGLVILAQTIKQRIISTKGRENLYRLI